MTNVAALFVHGNLIIPFAYMMIARCNPLKPLRAVGPGFLWAAITGSSLCAYPYVTFRLKKASSIFEHRVTSVVLPIGTVFSLNGTAIFSMISVIFLAQMQYFSLKVGDYFLLLVAILVMNSVAYLPDGGLLGLQTCLMLVGLPPDLCRVLIPVDLVLNRIRTIINVISNVYGCALLSKICKHRLMEKRDFTQSYYPQSFRTEDDPKLHYGFYDSY